MTAADADPIDPPYDELFKQYIDWQLDLAAVRSGIFAQSPFEYSPDWRYQKPARADRRAQYGRW